MNDAVNDSMTIPASPWNLAQLPWRARWLQTLDRRVSCRYRRKPNQPTCRTNRPFGPWLRPPHHRRHHDRSRVFSPCPDCPVALLHLEGENHPQPHSCWPYARWGSWSQYWASPSFSKGYCRPQWESFCLWGSVRGSDIDCQWLWWWERGRPMDNLGSCVTRMSKRQGWCACGMCKRKRKSQPTKQNK